jgi:hypothetical protein
MSFVGKQLSYYLWGQTFYTIDAPLFKSNAPASFIDVCAASASELGLLPRREDFSGGNAPIVAVPQALVQELYPKAAGRERTPELLRSLMRHAEVIVTRSTLVHPSCRGVVAAKLAFVAMAFNDRAEVEMYKTLIPGSLRINEAASMAFTDASSGGGGGRPAIILACALAIAFRKRHTIKKWLKNLVPKQFHVGLTAQRFRGVVSSASVSLGRLIGNSLIRFGLVFAGASAPISQSLVSGRILPGFLPAGFARRPLFGFGSPRPSFGSSDKPGRPSVLGSLRLRTLKSQSEFACSDFGSEAD